MKLEKFKKHGVRNKKIICSVVGIILLIGGFVLFKSFAFFETKYDFNVIKGRVPTFLSNDVKLAISVDGNNVENFPTSKRYQVEVTCDNGAVGSWDYENWGPNIRNVTKKTKCQIDFKTNNSNLYYKSDLISSFFR